MSDDDSEGFRNPEKKIDELSRDPGSIRERLIRFLCRRYGLTPVKAEELADEAVWTARVKMSTYDSKQAQLTTWLFTIAKNKALDYLRSPASRVQMVVLDDALLETTASASPDPQEVHRQTRLAEKLRAALDHLPRLQQRALELCDQQDYPRKDAAKLLKITVRQLDEALFQARRSIRQNRELWEEYHGRDYPADGKEAKQGRTRRNERVLRRAPKR